jgi:hypothetical protein
MSLTTKTLRIEFVTADGIFNLDMPLKYNNGAFKHNQKVFRHKGVKYRIITHFLAEDGVHRAYLMQW